MALPQLVRLRRRVSGASRGALEVSGNGVEFSLRNGLQRATSQEARHHKARRADVTLISSTSPVWTKLMRSMRAAHVPCVAGSITRADARGPEGHACLYLRAALLLMHSCCLDRTRDVGLRVRLRASARA